MSLITIDQLLESVDLDFEPRFVTKDEEGCVIIWGGEPERARDRWLGAEEFVMYPFLKLAEFENKDWQECIYEVPRKEVISKMETTGKIERLEIREVSHGGENMVLHIQKIPATAEEMHEKINELVDAVNELKGGK